MKRRLFIAVSFPDEVLADIEKEVALLKTRFVTSIRFLPRDNWHATLIFLGDQDERDITLIREAMDEALHAFSCQPIIFDRITYGPSGHAPRIIWWNATEPTSKYLGTIKDNLTYKLEKRGVQWEHENHPYHAHITLARFRESMRGLEESLFVPALVSCKNYTIELFESSLNLDGAEYSLLYSLGGA